MCTSRRSEWAVPTLGRCARASHCSKSVFWYHLGNAMSNRTPSILPALPNESLDQCLPLRTVDSPVSRPRLSRSGIAPAPMEDVRHVPGAEQHGPNNNRKPKLSPLIPLRTRLLPPPRPPLILPPTRPPMRPPVEMRRMRPAERVLPEPHAPDAGGLLVRGAPLLRVGAVAAALVEAVRRAAEGAARGVGAAAREARGRAAARRGGGRVVVGPAVVVVRGAEVAVVGGALGRGGEDGVGLRDADEALGGVGI